MLELLFVFLDKDVYVLPLKEDCVIFLDIDGTCASLQEDRVIVLDIDSTCLSLQEDCAILLGVDSALFYYKIVFYFSYIVRRTCYPF